MAKSKYYAVAVGRTVGIFTSWTECEKQVKGFRGAIFKSFPTNKDAVAFLEQHGTQGKKSQLSSAGVTTSSTPVGTSTSTSTTPSSTTGISTNEPTTLLLSTSNPPSKRQKCITSDSDLSFLISFDGGSRGNPGVAGSGAEVIEVRRKGTTGINVRSKTRLHRFLLGKQTNNQAEYWGLIAGLECVYESLSTWVDEKQDTPPVQVVSLAIQGDSRLIIQQMKGAFKVGPVLLSTYQHAIARLRQIQDLCTSHKIVLELTLEHVYRDQNQIADECANKAMDAQKSWSVYTDSEGVETRKELLDIDLPSITVKK